MNIFNRKKQEDEPQPNEFETTILKKLDEQLEFNQLLIKKITTLENNYEKLKEQMHEECEVLHRKITIESRKLNEQLLHMSDINLTREDITKLIDIGYEYLQEEYEFEIVPEDNTETSQDTPVTITDVLEFIEDDKTLPVNDNLKESKKKKTGMETKNHLFKIANSLKIPYHLRLLPNGHFKNKDKINTKQTKFTIHEVIDLKEKIPYFYEQGYTFKKIAFQYPRLSQAVVKRLIWNIEEGYFDHLIKEYHTGTPEYENKLSFTINEKYRKPYTIEKLDGVELYRKGQGRNKLGFTILDVLYVKENLPRWISKQTPRAHVVEETGMAPDRLQRVIYNVQEGIFNPYLEEFEDIGVEHKFALVDNKLYIDAEDTGLFISSCRTILHDYTHADDKYKCLKNLLRTYKNIKSKYIVLITKYYNDSNLRDLIIHSDTDCITVINNPEKRREYGTSLIGI